MQNTYTSPTEDHMQAQYMQRPTEDHIQALRRLLRYLSGTSHMVIVWHKNSPLTLHAFSDADWARDRDDYISTTAYNVYHGKNPISWTSKKQRTRARSVINRSRKPSNSQCYCRTVTALQFLW